MDFLSAGSDLGVAPPHALMRGASLFLDFDGTLVELAERPDLVMVDDALLALLGRLQRALNGRLAIISGRSAASIQAFLPDLSIPIGGSHGQEIRRAGDNEEAIATPQWVVEASARAGSLRRDHPGVLVEQKPFGIALHYREAPAAEAAVQALAAELLAPDRCFQPGKMVIEVRQAGGDKGHALRSFMTDPEMVGSVPIFIGDDLTDEPAFQAAVDMGGAGILVGPPRASAAAYNLPNVAATLAWLSEAMEEARA